MMPVVGGALLLARRGSLPSSSFLGGQAKDASPTGKDDPAVPSATVGVVSWHHSIMKGAQA
ncbi:MAG: hypothetical protein OZSIB_3601 [Candidatus Ozemobacter sibiricus]|uniref:Uncharacterized protein n=1 Tax=Candidatus Ozemobacter sibiricus TaxID=2268124 RepID=A0A367ZQI0_9BACT|nr:MAG: hypothetical protein OZSIB_3601 [Candidatus Ozemobacter sibiricus]